MASLHASTAPHAIDSPRFAPIVSLDSDVPGGGALFAMDVGGTGEAHVRLACAVGALLTGQQAHPGRGAAVMVSLALEELERLDVDSLVTALIADGIGADRLVVRVPQYTAGVPNPVLERIAARGVTVAVASLVVPPGDAARLAGAPIDVVELPPLLVEDVDRTPTSPERLEPWLGLAHSLDWLVLARNVRRPGQARALHRLGCDLAAGPLMGAPVDPAMFATADRRRSRLAG